MLALEGRLFILDSPILLEHSLSQTNPHQRWALIICFGRFQWFLINGKSKVWRRGNFLAGFQEPSYDEIPIGCRQFFIGILFSAFALFSKLLIRWTLRYEFLIHTHKFWVRTLHQRCFYRQRFLLPGPKISLNERTSTFRSIAEFSVNQSQRRKRVTNLISFISYSCHSLHNSLLWTKILPFRTETLSCLKNDIFAILHK